MDFKSYNIQYKVEYEASSHIRIHVDISASNSNKFIIEIIDLGFIQGSDYIDEMSKLPYLIMSGYLENLNLDVIKRLLNKYDQDGVIILVEIVYSFKDIAEIYPLIFDMVDNEILCFYIKQQKLNGMFYIEIRSRDMREILDNFDITGLGFEYYNLSIQYRIVVENDNQLRKMKLVGLLDFIIRCLYLTMNRSVLAHLQWKL